jgi:hypothetical protein
VKDLLVKQAQKGYLAAVQQRRHFTMCDHSVCYCELLRVSSGYRRSVFIFMVYLTFYSAGIKDLNPLTNGLRAKR